MKILVQNKKIELAKMFQQVKGDSETLLLAEAGLSDFSELLSQFEK